MSKSTLVGIRDRIVVEPIAADDKKHRALGLVFSTADLDKSKRGRVVSVGAGLVATDGTPIALAVREDDIVVFDKMAGKTVFSYGKELVILRENEILCVEREPSA